MRCLVRNKVAFYYALYTGKVAVTDAQGHETGEMKPSYSTPVLMKANISASSGDAQVEQFGTSISYDRVIVTDNTDCPIDENSVLCVDSSPSYDASGNLKYDYIVTKVARSLNSVSIAISKVKVS